MEDIFARINFCEDVFVKFNCTNLGLLAKSNFAKYGKIGHFCERFFPCFSLFLVLEIFPKFLKITILDLTFAKVFSQKISSL